MRTYHQYIISYLLTSLNFLSTGIFSFFIYKSSNQLVEFYAFVLVLFSTYSVFELGLAQKMITSINNEESFDRLAKPIVLVQILLTVVLSLFFLKIQITIIGVGLIFRSLNTLLYNKVLFSGSVTQEAVFRFLLGSGYQVIILISILSGFKLSENYLSISILLGYFLLFAFMFKFYKVKITRNIDIRSLRELDFKFFMLNFSSFYLFSIPIVFHKIWPSAEIIKYSLFLQIINLFVQFSAPLKSLVYSKVRDKDYVYFFRSFLKFTLLIFVSLLAFYLIFNQYSGKIYTILNLKIQYSDFVVIGNYKILLIIFSEICVGMAVLYSLKYGIANLWISSTLTSICLFLVYYFQRNSFDNYLKFALVSYLLCLYIPNLFTSLASIKKITPYK